MQAVRKTETIADTAPAENAASIVVEREAQDVSVAPSLQQMAAISGTSPIALVREYAGLAFGPGGLSFSDFVRMRLFDNVFWQGADKRQVISARRNMDLAMKINWRHEHFGLMLDKIASRSYLAAYGLPTIPTQAIWAPDMKNGAPWLLANRAQLVSFLMRDDVYPLFGKPVTGVQSLGSIAFSGRVSDTELQKLNGETVLIERFVSDVEANYSNGYVFQSVVLPHPDIVALSGERLGTARIVTIMSEDGPQILRTAWKIPSTANLVDNFWRAGNMLARLDMDSGTVTKVISGDGVCLVDVTRHPDTGSALIGARVPNWQDMKALALEGARVMNKVGLIGWDIASTADGPVVVEMNVTPDLCLCQLADARGILDDTFTAFVAYQKRLAQLNKR